MHEVGLDGGGPGHRYHGLVSIRTPDQRLRVFVSSTLEELAEDRRVVREAIEGLRLTPVMFELGQGRTHRVPSTAHTSSRVTSSSGCTGSALGGSHQARGCRALRMSTTWRAIDRN